jgi:hypothetical protein
LRHPRRPSRRVVTITALSLDPDAAIGGVVCQDCIEDRL